AIATKRRWLKGEATDKEVAASRADAYSAYKESSIRFHGWIADAWTNAAYVAMLAAEAFIAESPNRAAIIAGNVLGGWQKYASWGNERMLAALEAAQAVTA
ncbi:MAG: hypothetical protein Q8R28_08860, partial [Dehalococcoidia bacterium]|nr:hypothetical protein [Dehalococcoidia bacterium]